MALGPFFVEASQRENLRFSGPFRQDFNHVYRLLVFLHGLRAANPCGQNLLILDYVHSVILSALLRIFKYYFKHPCLILCPVRLAT